MALSNFMCLCFIYPPLYAMRCDAMLRYAMLCHIILDVVALACLLASPVLALQKSTDRCRYLQGQHCWHPSKVMLSTDTPYTCGEGRLFGRTQIRALPSSNQRTPTCQHGDEVAAVLIYASFIPPFSLMLLLCFDNMCRAACCSAGWLAGWYAQRVRAGP